MFGLYATRWMWWFAFCILLIVLLIPFLLAEMPPILDYPNHLARAIILAAGQHDPVLSRMYAPHWGIIPDLATDLILPPLLYVLPLHLAGRLVLAGSMLLPLCGAIAYNRILFGRLWYWSLGSALVAFNAGFLLGFLNFLFGIGCAFAVVAVWVGWRERRSFATALVVACGSVLIFFCHVIALALLGILIVSHEIDWIVKQADHGNPLCKKLITRRAIVIFVVFLPAAVLYVLSPLARAGGGAEWLPALPISKPLFALTPLMNYSLAFDTVTGCILLMSVLLAARKGWIVMPRSTGIALGLLTVAYLIAPFRLKGGSFFDIRFALMAGYLLFAGFAENAWLSRCVVNSAALCFLAVFGARIGLIFIVWSEQNAQVAEMRAVVQTVPPGARVLTALVMPSDAPNYWRDAPTVRRLDNLWLMNFHIPVLLLVQRRAFSPYLFGDPSEHPIALRAPYDKLATVKRISEPPSYTLLGDPMKISKKRQQYPYLEHWSSNFDYVLIINAGGLADGARLYPKRLKLLRWTDAAALYRVRRQRPLNCGP